MGNLKISQKQELDLLRTVINNGPDQTYLIYESGIILDIFKGRERTMPINLHKLIGHHFSTYFSRELCNIIELTIDEVLTDCLNQLITYMIYPSDMMDQDTAYFCDNVFTYEARVSVIKLKSFDQRLIMWTARDITQRVKLEKEINYLLERDELTGILNRRKFMSHLRESFEQFRRYSTEVSIIIADIDNFKECNDTYGHFSGDEVIKHVTQVCSKHLRKCDYFGRLGGEEFAIILPNTTLEQAVEVAQRLCDLVYNTPCVIENDIEVETTLSIGVSQFITEDISINDALNRADQATYLSKRNGKNQISHKLI
ncbi:GGDEF domain-containing protein [Vibrio alginolyticus]|nr:GGDEF domain-containing protein [Vibrio alginolyticus]